MPQAQENVDKATPLAWAAAARLNAGLLDDDTRPAAAAAAPVERVAADNDRQPPPAAALHLPQGVPHVVLPLENQAKERRRQREYMV